MSEITKKTLTDYLEQIRRVLYNAIVLIPKDVITLRNNISKYLSDDEKTNWKEYFHHQTISLGPCKEENKQYLDSTQKLKVIEIGKSDKCVAVRVEELGPVKTANKIPHITCLVSPIGKPMNSNDITDWKKIEEPFIIEGVFKEILPGEK